jgi:hypothetical protein
MGRDLDELKALVRIMAATGVFHPPEYCTVLALCATWTHLEVNLYYRCSVQGIHTVGAQCLAIETLNLAAEYVLSIAMSR